MRLFADDCFVYKIINSLNDCLKLQEDLSLLCDWESKWQMEFNKSKCHVLHMSRKKQSIGTLYYLKDTPLEISTKQKYLGFDFVFLALKSTYQRYTVPNHVLILTEIFRS